MPKDLTVTALAMWGLFALGVIVGTCYCYYSDNHIDEKLGVSKGKIKLSVGFLPKKGIEMLCAFEGFEPAPYLDAVKTNHRI